MIWNGGITELPCCFTGESYSSRDHRTGPFVSRSWTCLPSDPVHQRPRSGSPAVHGTRINTARNPGTPTRYAYLMDRTKALPEPAHGTAPNAGGRGSYRKAMGRQCFVGSSLSSERILTLLLERGRSPSAAAPPNRGVSENAEPPIRPTPAASGDRSRSNRLREQCQVRPCLRAQPQRWVRSILKTTVGSPRGNINAVTEANARRSLHGSFEDDRMSQNHAGGADWGSSVQANARMVKSSPNKPAAWVRFIPIPVPRYADLRVRA
jgi:hypothetical protein